jgi:hypothetical protein
VWASTSTLVVILKTLEVVKNCLMLRGVDVSTVDDDTLKLLCAEFFELPRVLVHYVLVKRAIASVRFPAAFHGTLVLPDYALSSAPFAFDDFPFLYSDLALPFLHRLDLSQLFPMLEVLADLGLHLMYFGD